MFKDQNHMFIEAESYLNEGNVNENVIVLLCKKNELIF